MDKIARIHLVIMAVMSILQENNKAQKYHKSIQDPSG